MRGQKRPLWSDSDSLPSASKKQRPAVAPGPNVDEEEVSLESILELIQAQEESEALARKLQQEWNAPGPSSPQRDSGASRRAITPDSVIEISDDDEREDDETIARRLAKQWELEDAEARTAPKQTCKLRAPKANVTPSMAAGPAQVARKDPFMRCKDSNSTRIRCVLQASASAQSHARVACTM
ncbi:hypothetical protein BN946_scf185013.g65 [Trametes cinnabarina]|uniref:Uncharacterized protein n=1 Tax=Pycnoporus cinnabarinus TaxID=5643 RepID=A0A060SGX1_PYCCI|nr:hypothetical protein BN946_scf185013.g65 [Trametes cinnabarina]